MLIAVTVVYWRESPTGMVAVALMCGGDGIADIAGRRFGKGNPLPHNRNKSWAGSFAMFAGVTCVEDIIMLSSTVSCCTRLSLAGQIYCDGRSIRVSALHFKCARVSMRCRPDDAARLSLCTGIHAKWRQWCSALFAGGYGLAMLFVLAFHALGYFNVDVPSTAAAVALIALAATAVESLPINQSIDDNLSVPGIAALVSHFMLRACVRFPAI